MQRLDVRVPTPLHELRDERFGGMRLLLKRDDLLHPQISGNKWRKLKYVLEDARAAHVETLLTFGGAYSNHIRATAAAGRLLGFRTIGVIRGDERPHNEVLAASIADGMRIHYVDRETYRRRAEPAFHEDLRRRLGDFQVIPEGGTSVRSLLGCAEMVSEIECSFDLIVTAVGTGGTLAGIATGLDTGQRALGISVLKGAFSLDAEVDQLQQKATGQSWDNWTIDHRFHHGGFARRSPGLDAFLADLDHRHGLRFDGVYVGKMLFALAEIARTGSLDDVTVVAVVTGPLAAPERDRGATFPT